MPRVLLKIFAVLNKQAFWSKFKITGVPILVTHIIKFWSLPQVPQLQLEQQIRFYSSTSFVFQLLNPGSGRSSLVLFSTIRVSKLFLFSNEVRGVSFVTDGIVDSVFDKLIRFFVTVG